MDRTLNANLNVTSQVGLFSRKCQEPFKGLDLWVQHGDRKEDVAWKYVLGLLSLLTPACQLHHSIRKYCDSFLFQEEEPGAASCPEVQPPFPLTL